MLRRVSRLPRKSDLSLDKMAGNVEEGPEFNVADFLELLKGFRWSVSGTNAIRVPPAIIIPRPTRSDSHGEDNIIADDIEGARNSAPMEPTITMKKFLDLHSN